MAEPAAILSIFVQANTKMADGALLKTQAGLRQTETAGTRMSSTLKKAFIGIGAAAAVTGVALFKVGEEFDEAYDKIRTRTGATGKELKKLEGDFKSVVKNVPTDFDSASEAVAGLNQRLDITGKPLRKLSKQMTQLSLVTKTDVGENVESLTRLFGDWEVKTADQAKTLDGLFRISQKTGSSVSDIARSLVQFGAPLRNLGIDMDFAAAMFANFEKSGVNMTTVMSGLRLSVANLAAPTDELAATLKKLGIDAKDPEQALADVFERIKTLNDQASKSLAIEVFGRRAGSDLRDSVLTGRFELDKLIETFRNGDETIGKAERQTRDFSEEWDLFVNNLKVAVEPTATKVFKAVGKAMKEVTDIIGDKSLTGDEKFSKVLDLISQKIQDGLPKIADAGAKIAAKLGSGFVKAWWEGDAITKLFGAAAFIRLIGGAGVFGKIGGRLAKWLGSAFATRVIPLMAGAIVGAEGAGGLIGLLKGPGSRAMKAVGNLLGTRFGVAFSAAAITFGAKAFYDWFKNNDPTGDSPLTKPFSDSFEQFKHLFSSMNNVADKQTNQLVSTTRKGFDKVGDAARKNSQSVKSRWGEALTKTGAEGREKSQRFAAQVGGNFRNLASASLDALASLAGETNKTLKSLKVKDQVYVANKVKGGGSNAIKAQKGAIVPGSGSGDKVPLHIGGELKAMVEPGELVSVANKKATASLMKANAAVPRFAAGGALDFALGPYDIPPIQYAADHAGGNSHVHITGTTTPWVVAIGKQLQKMGFMVGEHPAFGGVGAGHSPTGGHYDALAIDVNSAADETQAEVASIAKLLGGKGAAGAVGAAVAKLAKYVLEGPKGPLKAAGQASIDTAWKAMDALIRKNSQTDPGSVGNVDVGKLPSGSFSVDDMASLWSSVGGPKAVSHTAGAIGMAESHGDPRAYNPSGASGLWQILGQVVGGDIFDPVVNAKNAVKKYTDAGGWSPWEAYTNGAYQQYMQRGGIVEMLAGGGILGSSLNALGAKKPKRRHKALKQALGKIKGFGLDDYTMDLLSSLSEDADLFFDKAGRANAKNEDIPWTLENVGGSFEIADELGTVLQRFSSETDAVTAFRSMTDPLLGRFQGATEAEWLQKQLQSLFLLRAHILGAEEMIVDAREKAGKALEDAEDALKDVRGKIRRAEGQQGRIEDDIASTRDKLEKAQKHPQQNHQQIKALREKLDRLGGDLKDNREQLGGFDRQRGALETLIGGDKGIKQQIAGLSTTRGELLGQGGSWEISGRSYKGLQTVQGDGPMSRLTSLPSYDEILDLFSGEMFDTALSLRDLGATKIPLRAADSGSTGTSSEIADLKALDNLDWAKRFQVSQAQYDVLRNYPTAPYMGAFARGGVALVGERGPELATLPSGTRITPADETASMVRPVVNVKVAPGMEWLKQFISVEIDNQSRKDSRPALPGAGGGVLTRG